MTILLDDIRNALAEGRYETARRLGFASLGNGVNGTPPVIFALHDALVQLADFHEARALLEGHADHLEAHEFQTKLLLASDLRKLGGDNHYRLSEEARQGFTLEEYKEKYDALAAQALEAARSLAKHPEEEAQLAKFAEGKDPHGRPRKNADTPPPAAAGDTGGVRGRIMLENRLPAAGLEVTLGLKAYVEHVDPATFITHEMHYAPVIPPLQKATTQTDAAGRFLFEQVPVGVHEFIAVTLPPEEPAVATRFLQRSIAVTSGRATELGDLRVTAWQSAPAPAVRSPHPPSVSENGTTWEKCAEWTLHNPFYYDFPRQLLLLPLPAGEGSWRVVIDPATPEPHQIVDGQLALLTDLPPKTDKVIALYRTGATLSPPVPEVPVILTRESTQTWCLDTGAASFRLAGDGSRTETPPLLAVRGPDGQWRGEGRFRLPDGVTISAREVRVVEEGPVLTSLEFAYSLSNGAAWSLRLTALAGEPLLLAHERSAALEHGAFEFSLREFSGGRGFLHWGPETGSLHWTTLEPKDAVVGNLPESIPWWIPPQGFGYAMTADGLEQQDYVGIFSRRRGEWIDRAFEQIAQGPTDEDGTENRELDWPFPEMVGSSISRINVHTARGGDAFFRFGFFDGERQWGLLVSSFARNDGAFKEFGRLQHAYSSPRLQEFKDWHLDVADTLPRPHSVARRDDLPTLRRKTHAPRFGGLWRKIRTQPVPGARDGLVFALEGDPLMAWRKRIHLLAIAEVHARMVLLGRDFADVYSPVGGRDITKYAEEYDLIAASGVFTPEEERTVRAFFLLMGHMFMEEDFMNWRFNGRNANFEADRVDIIAAVGLAFQGHPDAPKFIGHAIERTEKSLVAYCTPGSGKWYENPACYYLHASKCRMNLVYHLGHRGMLDLEAVPRLKDFLRWALHLLTPPQPVLYEIMHAGDEASYDQASKVRKVPPVGDHAGIGRWLPEHYAFIGKLFLKTDPTFGRELIDAFFCGNADGQRLLGRIPWEEDGPESDPQAPHHGSYFGNLPLFFCALDEADLPAEPSVTPASRRLEGFGAILRNKVNTPHESCLLIKQGPGGYRYHRTEGSFLWFADGRPLVYDGGEAGETWRHSTLSFHDVHLPLSAGHVERYFDRHGIQFVQGVHPVILHPGDPVFLSDNCRHELVPESRRRFCLEPPAVARSFAWIDDEYLVVHDDLSASRPDSSHWHLQVVGDAPQRTGDNAFRFPGRFGVDLEVVLPGQTFAAEKIHPLPIMHYVGTPDQWFTMQHLQLSRPHASHYLAVLRPTRFRVGAALQAHAIKENDAINGARVVHGHGEDLLWFRRGGLVWSEGDTRFEGSFGALLNRPDHTRLALLGRGSLATAAAGLSSDGPSAVLILSGDGATVEAEGSGSITVDFRGTRRTFPVSPATPLAVRLPA